MEESGRKAFEMESNIWGSVVSRESSGGERVERVAEWESSEEEEDIVGLVFSYCFERVERREEDGS